MDMEFLNYPLVNDTCGECVDDFSVRNTKDTAANSAEAVNVLTESFALTLPGDFKILPGCEVTVGRLEIDLELEAKTLPGGGRFLGEAPEPRAGVVLECRGKPICHGAVIPMSS